MSRKESGKRGQAMSRLRVTGAKSIGDITGGAIIAISSMLTPRLGAFCKRWKIPATRMIRLSCLPRIMARVWGITRWCERVLFTTKPRKCRCFSHGPAIFPKTGRTLHIWLPVWISCRHFVISPVSNHPKTCEAGAYAQLSRERQRQVMNLLSPKSVPIQAGWFGRKVTSISHTETT